ncbi:MAG: bifunctional (p)ppGpp synthetase/guanosine-3',5'-bis(diphosphate) 3'-pyrophosphohydrolase [Chloroflexota bacterium]|nr:bifunctional (p)ppGpp synthetase/guanosine-3',5'-bis(diphosphate) 3'-pyrophosphohydrolase [Chloroflexota bacterium]
MSAASPKFEGGATERTPTQHDQTDGHTASRPALQVIDSHQQVTEHPAPKGKTQTSVDALVRLVHSYSPTADTDAIKKAYHYAADAHEGQKRGTGEPYISHPLQVAMLLAEMRLDIETLQAALLHDVIEDTPVTYEDISSHFGPIVAHLVEGVTKLGSIPKLRLHNEAGQSKNDSHQQAENLRKMFLAMFDDPRVVLIKLADRLHNMRTLQGVLTHKQQRIAAQTLEIYSPLANRLGMWQMKGELEDLSFSYLNPEQHAELVNMLRETKVARDRYLKRVISTLEKTLASNGIKATIKGRIKHIYSLWQKMQRKQRDVEHIYDVLAVRVIVESKQDCYAALGIIHSLWPPIPGEFDDYISRPKESMYQSLHTAVWALENKPLEIQIRTQEMHELAEFGIAAHWRYKEQRGGKRDLQYEEKIAWLRRLMSWRDEVESAQDFVDSLKSDLFQEHIYVFTPQGDIVELPKGATPIDFAFRIHTDLGYQCIGAKVNEKIVPLDAALQNGAVVRIIKDKNRAGPSRDWLQSDRFLKTAAARQKVRQYFRKQRRDEKIAQGRTILEQTLKHLGLNHVSHADVLGYYPRFGNLDDFMEAIGNTDISSQNISSKLGEHRQEELLLPKSDAPTVTVPMPATISTTMQVSDLGGILTQFGRCCKPMPGDEIIGYTTRGRGITVHRADCPNLNSVEDTGRLMRVAWDGGKGVSRYPAGVRVEALDRVGLLRDVTTMLADDKVNLISIHTNKKPSRATSTLIMTLEVTGVEQLYQLMDRLKSIRGVYEVQRDTGTDD